MEVLAETFKQLKFLKLQLRFISFLYGRLGVIESSQNFCGRPNICLKNFITENFEEKNHHYGRLNP